MGTATVPDVPVGERTAVVSVEAVLEAPAELAEQAGKPVTVELAEAAKIGDRLIFFTSEWLSGREVAVRETGRLDLEQAPREPAKAVSEARRRLADAELKRHLRAADAVVVGRVAATRAPRREAPPRITEHDPQWQEAVLEVRSVEKGRLPQRRVTFLFARSRDVMWFQAPRFRKGQEGVWLLNRAEVQELAREAFVVVEPLAFHSMRELPRIGRLLEEIG